MGEQKARDHSTGSQQGEDVKALPANERLIVALDFDSDAEALGLVHKLGNAVTFYKVGLQLFMRNGLKIVKKLTNQGKKVFLDLKIDDTPRTVETTVHNMAMDGVLFFTLQGNSATARAAREGRGAHSHPKFLQVTYLSSWDESDLREVFHVSGSQKIVLDELVISRTGRILDSGCDGVIASGTSVRRLRSAYPPEVIIVSPGIRPKGAPSDDHKRTMTPEEAILSGSDYLVVGRPISKARDPIEVASAIQDDIARALSCIKI